MRLDFCGQQEPHARASGFWDRRATSGGSFYISAFFKKKFGRVFREAQGAGISQARICWTVVDSWRILLIKTVEATNLMVSGFLFLQLKLNRLEVEVNPIVRLTSCMYGRSRKVIISSCMVYLGLRWPRSQDAISLKTGMR